MPSLPFLRSSLDRERDRERQRDASRERLPISPPANAASRSQQQQQSAASTPPASSASNTPTRSFSDRLLRRKPSISTKQSGGSLSGKSIPPVPPLSAGLTEYEAGSEPRTASTVGDVFAELQDSSGRDERHGRPADIIMPSNSYTTQIPDTHPFALRNDLRPPTLSSSKSSHSHIPSQHDEPPRSAPLHRFAAPTSPSPNRNTPTPESSNSGRGPSAMAEWLSQKPSRGKLRSASHGSAAARPLVPLPPLPPPSLRHRSSPRVARVSDRMVNLMEQNSVDEGQSQSDTEGSLDGTAYEVAVACTDTDGEIKWEVSIRRRPPSTAGVSAHSHNLTPALGKSTILAPSNASSINLSLALGQPTGKLVFIQFPMDASSPTKRRAKATSSAVSSPFAPHARSSTFGSSETPCTGPFAAQTSPSLARIPVLGAPLSSQTFSPEDRPTEPPSLVRPETPPPRMKTPPPLPATPLSDVRTPRRGHARTASRNQNSTPARALQYAPDTPTRTERTSLDRLERSDEGVGISTTLNGELISSPRGSTPRRHRIVSASQLNGGLYATGTVDGLSEDLESELVLGGELVPPEGRPRTFGGRF